MALADHNAADPHNKLNDPACAYAYRAVASRGTLRTTNAAVGGSGSQVNDRDQECWIGLHPLSNEALGFSDRLQSTRCTEKISRPSALTTYSGNVGKAMALSPIGMRGGVLAEGQALILVLLLSFGLWVVIWGAIALLAMCGRQ